MKLDVATGSLTQPLTYLLRRNLISISFSKLLISKHQNNDRNLTFPIHFHDGGRFSQVVCLVYIFGSTV